MTEGELLEDLADAIVTGRPVDWDRAEASSSPDVRALLRELRVVAGIADLHREAYRGVPVLGPATFSQSGERLPPEDSWGPLRLIEPVGDGAAGRVYRAWDTRLDREVALKLIRTRHLGSAATVLHEGRLLARLRHPNIVTVYGAEEYDGRAGLWMEFVEGQTLETIARDRGPLPIDEAVRISIDVCEALQAVHDAGLLHRDLKTENVMRDGSGRVVLMDFHAGSIADTPHAGDLVGTPMCLAPEILVDRQPASVQSDIYSAAVVAFRLLTAAYPVSAESLDALRDEHRNGTPVSLSSLRPDVPARLAAAVERGLARSPVDRPSSANEFGSSLAESVDMGQEHRVPPFWWAAAVTLVVTCASTVAIGVDSATRRSKEASGRTASSAFGLTMSELDWKDFVPMSPPTSDGRRIAGWVTSAPAVRDLTSGEMTVVQRRAGEDDSAGHAALSPDGRLLAYGWYTGQPDGTERVEIRLAEIGSGTSHAIVAPPHLTDASIVAWTPNARGLLAVIAENGGPPTLAVIDLQTGGTTRLHAFPSGAPLGVSLSPDGATVAYDEPTQKDASTRDISLLDLATGQPRALVVAPSNDLYPCWLPDGHAITFASDRGGTLGLWRVDAAGGQVTPPAQLIKGGMGRFDPLGFTAAGDLYFRLQTTVIDIYRWSLPMGVETSSPAPIVGMFVGQNLDADWAPDGRSIAYVSRRGEVPFSRRSMGLVVRSLTTGRERLFIPDADGVHDPRWAPDGVHILFNARTGNNDRLEILSTRDGMMRELSPAAPWFVPEWSGTGERLYGTVGRSGKFGIRVRDLASGHESELAWPVNMFFAVSHDERWLAMGLLGHDGAPAIGVRAAAGGEWRQAFRAEPADRLFTIGWSPDDTKLFAWRRTGLGTEHVVTEIWSVSVANGVPGTPLRLGVVPGMNDARKFRLSPDGREVLFTAGSIGGSTWLMRGIQ
jgi:hypothetical protein